MYFIHSGDGYSSSFGNSVPLVPVGSVTYAETFFQPTAVPDTQTYTTLQPYIEGSREHIQRLETQIYMLQQEKTAREIDEDRWVQSKQSFTQFNVYSFHSYSKLLYYLQK